MHGIQMMVSLTVFHRKILTKLWGSSPILVLEGEAALDSDRPYKTIQYDYETLIPDHLFSDSNLWRTYSHFFMHEMRVSTSGSIIEQLLGAGMQTPPSLHGAALLVSPLDLIY